MGEPVEDRLNRLRDEIGYALGRGELPEDKLREFRFLWRTTPDSEKEGLSFNLQDIETMVKDLRREQGLANGAGKVKRIPIEHTGPQSIS